MMRQFGKKLKNDAGVTIIFALVIFILASVASLTIVSVALNNIHRVDEQQEVQRGYLAVTSAAALLREELAQGTVTIEQEFNCDQTGSPMGERADKRKLEGDNDSDFARALAQAMLYAKENSGDKFDVPYELTYSTGDADSELTVKVAYTGTRVEMEIKPKAGGQSMPMTLVFDGAKVEQSPYVPHPKYDAVKEEWVVEYLSRTTWVTFAEDHAYAKAE